MAYPSSDPGIESEPESVSDATEQSAGEEGDGEYTYTTWKEDLGTCLDAIETTGDFAACKGYSAFVNPDLEVAGTPIPLPLTARDAQAIRGACRLAPYGKGEATLVDESVRKTWELGRDEFRLANQPDWDAFVADALLRDLAEKALGMPSSGVRAEPYKLLLYEEGSFFRKHKDSEKVAGMIDTLVVCLPARHDGGDVRLSHAGKSRMFATSRSSAYGLTALAWFSDVTHEITQVTSGYRLVLTYNIIQTGGLSKSAGSLAKQHKQLQKAISEWKVKYNSTKRLFYCLEHQYTRSSLSLENLKGRDHAVCHSLYSLCLENGLYLFIYLTYSKEEEGYYGGEDSLTVSSIHGCDGSLIAEDLDIEPEEIIGNNPYEDGPSRDPDSESEGEYTGNEGVANTLRYHDTAAMIVSREYLYEILDEEDGDGRAIYWVIQPNLAEDSTDASSRSFHLKIINIILDSPRRLDHTVLSDIYRWAVESKLEDLLRRVVRASVSISAVDELLTTISELINKDYNADPSPKPDWDVLLGEYESSMQGLSEFSSIYHEVESLLGHDALKESLRSWWSSVEEGRFESKVSLDLEDLDFVMKLITAHSTDLKWIQSSASRDGKLEHAVAITKDLVESAQPKLALEAADFFLPKWDPRPGGAGGAASRRQQPGPVAERGASEQPSRGRRGRGGAAARVRVVAAAVRDAAARLRGGPVRDPAAHVRLRRRADAPTPPRRLPGWAHRPRGCGCEDCRDLDRFLSAADERVGRFTVNKDKRQHIEYRLPRYYGDKSREIFSCSLDQRRKPYTLVITKTRQGREFEEDTRVYRESLERFERRVRPLRLEYVEQSMGEARYRELVMLENLQVSTGQRPLAEQDEKRKADDPADDLSSKRPRLR
ncbi:hypothetical protein DL764_009885 [Monosporascus ibericus]|uniref:Uncharacterized protein n=1 Tax=Monosporascus ibericus TaxID=155417 RepID=A0A4Q4STU1_9PEZI|nr:hypothetical protein DL764_009885 [Monosporascus ibericus]